MLTAKAVAYLTPLTYRPNAERLSCLIPLGGIYWEDEIPDFRGLQKLPEKDRAGIYHLFRIRFLIWERTELIADDLALWEAARAQVPNYALFHRTEITDDDRVAQRQVERNAEEAFNALTEDADEVSFKEKHGFTSFSATFDLTKDNDRSAPKKPWWRRLFG